MEGFASNAVVQVKELKRNSASEAANAQAILNKVASATTLEEAKSLAAEASQSLTTLRNLDPKVADVVETEEKEEAPAKKAAAPVVPPVKPEVKKVSTEEVKKPEDSK